MLDDAALIANWRWLAARSGPAACGAAVKADGYGLGAVEVVARLARAGCRDFFVASWAEADALGALPAGASIAVLHGVRAEDMAAALALPARPVLNTARQVARWRETGRPCDVMIDTGMNRLGLSPDEARSGLLDGLAIDTLMSHLACADDPGDAMNERQLAAFGSLQGVVPARRYSLANSAGVCLGPRYAFQLTRPGLAIYGGVPVRGDAEQARALAQVVRPQAQVLQVRDVPAGGSVGYGADFRATQALRVAILNLGYGDGYLRSFGGVGSVSVAQATLPVIGRVSMDLIAVDCGAVDVREGDWLSIDYRLEHAAAVTGLSQYELLTSLGRRYQRAWT